MVLSFIGHIALMDDDTISDDIAPHSSAEAAGTTSPSHGPRSSGSFMSNLSSPHVRHSVSGANSPTNTSASANGLESPIYGGGLSLNDGHENDEYTHRSDADSGAGFGTNVMQSQGTGAKSPSASNYGSSYGAGAAGASKRPFGPDSIVLTLEQEKAPQPKMYRPILHRLKTFALEKEHQLHEIMFNPLARRQFLKTYFGWKNIVTCVASVICFFLLISALVVAILLMPTRSSKGYIGSYVWVGAPKSAASLVHDVQGLQSVQNMQRPDHVASRLVSEAATGKFGPSQRDFGFGQMQEDEIARMDAELSVSVSSWNGIQTIPSPSSLSSDVQPARVSTAVARGDALLAAASSASDINVFNAFTEKVTNSIGTVEDSGELVGSVIYGNSLYLFWKHRWEERSATPEKDYNWRGAQGTYSDTFYGIGFANDLKEWIALFDKSGSRTNFVVRTQSGTEHPVAGISAQTTFARLAKYRDQVLVLTTLEDGSQQLFELIWSTGVVTAIPLNNYHFHALDNDRYAKADEPGFLASGRFTNETNSAGFSFGLSVTGGAIKTIKHSTFIDIGPLNERLSFYTFYTYDEVNSGVVSKKPVRVLSVINHENRLYGLNAISQVVYADTKIQEVSTIGLNPNIQD